jgi:hypothetical protein
MGVRGLQNFIRQYSEPRSLEDLLDPKNQKQKLLTQLRIMEIMLNQLRRKKRKKIKLKKKR